MSIWTFSNGIVDEFEQVLAGVLGVAGVLVGGWYCLWGCVVPCWTGVLWHGAGFRAQICGPCLETWPIYGTARLTAAATTIRPGWEIPAATPGPRDRGTWPQNRPRKIPAATMDHRNRGSSPENRYLLPHQDAEAVAPGRKIAPERYLVPRGTRATVAAG